MDKILLPFNNKPPYTAYHEQAFPLGIMEAHGINVNDWLCSESLVLWSPSLDLLQAHCSDRVSFAKYGPIISNVCFFYPYELINNPQAVIERIIGLISDGYYLSGYANYRAIPNNSAYGRFDRSFNLQIYGVNCISKTFNCISYISDNYRPFDITWDQFVESQRLQDLERIPFFTLKFNNEYRYQFDLIKAKKNLSDFLNSRYDFSNNEEYSDFKFGASAQERYLDYLKSCSQKEYKFDARNSRSLMEFKKVIFHLIKKHFSEEVKLNFSCLSELFNNYNRHHLLCVKSLIQNDYHYFKRAIKNLEETFKVETSHLKQCAKL